MNIVKLLKYSLYLFIMILVVFFVITIYMYFFSKQPAAEISYSIAVPLCIFIVSLLYAKSVHERGLIRGIEIWIVYFALVLLMKVIFSYPGEISIVRQLLYLPVSILGGILGVNTKLKIPKR